MRFSIKQKMVAGITILLIVLFSLVAFLFIREKKLEFADDLYFNSLAYVTITAPQIMDLYNTYLVEDGFVFFNKEISSLFRNNRELKRISVVKFDGEVVYDSDLDSVEKYKGDIRKVDDFLVKQIQSEYPSVLFDGLNEPFYLIDDGFRDYLGGGDLVKTPGLLVKNFVIPVDEMYSVLFEIDYSVLDGRINLMVERILLLAFLGIFIGLGFSGYMSGKFVKPIDKLVTASEKIAKGEFDTRVDVKTGDEIEFLGDSFNKMAVELKESMDAKMYKERVTRELELATAIQKQIVPKELPDVPGLDLAAGLIPAEEIGGDMYDFLVDKDGNSLFYLGDVTGHGVPSGIVSSVASALFYGYSLDNNIMDILVKVNRVLKAKTMANMFMTLCLMHWDVKQSVFSYLSAGHEQILHYKAIEKKVELLPSGGIALGMIENIENLLKIENVDLKEGDFLVIYSDGIPEAWRNQKENYGMERFVKAVESFGNLERAIAIKEAILADVEQFVNGYQQLDDITLIVVKRTTN